MKMNAILAVAAADDPSILYLAEATVQAVKHAAIPSEPIMNMRRRGYLGAINDSGNEFIKAQQL